MIECKFSLELTKNGIQRTIYAKAGEVNARMLIIALTQNGKVYDMSNHSARIYLENKTEYFDAVIDGNYVKAVIPNAFSEPQVRICELKIQHGGKTVYSPLFELVIEESYGEKAEAEALKSGEKFQPLLADAAIKDDAMEDEEDSVIVYDADSGKAKKLPWKEVTKMISGAVVKNHSELDGRDEENQHPISAINGLREELDKNESDISDAVQKFDTDLTETASGLRKEINDTEAFLFEDYQKRIASAQQQIALVSDDINQNIRPVVDELDAEVKEMQATIDHTHPNKDVLDSFGINNADTRPTFKGEVLATQNDVASRVAEHRAEVNEALEEVGGFTVNSMFLEAFTGVDIFDGYGNDIIGLMYPAADGAMPCGNDAVILDVGIVLQDGGEIRASQFPQSANFGADAVHHIFHMPQIDYEFGAYVLFRIVKDNYQGNELCGKLLTGEYSGVKIYYLGGY